MVTAVLNATRGTGGSPQAFPDGLHAGLVVVIAAAILGVAAMALRGRTRAGADVPSEAAVELEAA